MISVIILAKNEEKNIGKCLDYLYKQTYSDFETIVVDANSTDSTVEIAKSYGAKVIKEEKNKGGFGYGRNLGVRNSRGDIITFLSADIFLIDERTLEKSWKSLEEYKVDGVWCKLLFPQTPLGVYFSRPFEKTLKVTEEWGTRPPRTTCFLMLRKEVFDDVGLFDENFKEGVEDQDFIYRLYKSGKILLYDPGINVFHNTGCSIENQRKKTYKEGKMLKKFYEKHGIGDEGFYSVLYPLKAILASAYSCFDCVKRIGVKGLPIFLYNYQLMMERRRGFLQDIDTRGNSKFEVEE